MMFGSECKFTVKSFAPEINGELFEIHDKILTLKLGVFSCALG